MVSTGKYGCELGEGQEPEDVGGEPAGGGKPCWGGGLGAAMLWLDAMVLESVEIVFFVSKLTFLT